MNTPYLVLGHYKPSVYRGSVIGPAILALIAKHNLVPHIDPVHGPQTTSIWCDEAKHAEVRRFAQPGGQGAAWHQDGDLKDGAGMDHAAVLWASVCPTEFKVDDTIYQPKPFEIVIARNLGCYHRTPPNAPKPPTRRWLFRQRVAVPHYLALP